MADSLFLITRTNYRASLGLAITDIVQQRDVGRTGELARTTFDAVHDVVLLGLIEIIMFGHLVEQEGLQTHGASYGTAATADTVGLTTVLRFLKSHE